MCKKYFFSLHYYNCDRNVPQYLRTIITKKTFKINQLYNFSVTINLFENLSTVSSVEPGKILRKITTYISLQKFYHERVYDYNKGISALNEVIM